MSKDDSLGDATLKFFSAIGILLYAMTCDGFVFSVMWKWFVVPLGMPSLTLVNAIGCILMVRFFFRFKNNSGNKNTLSESVVTILVKPWIFLGLGWLVTLFM